MAKSEFLQIRISAQQKRALRVAAAAAGQDISSYVLARALPAARARFAALVRQLPREAEQRFVLAELNDLLTGLTSAQLADAVAEGLPPDVSPFLASYVAAMVEMAAHRAGIPAPPWTRRIPPLETPYFAVGLRSLRAHLLRASPVPFRRRNLFIDASLGARV